MSFHPATPSIRNRRESFRTSLRRLSMLAVLSTFFAFGCSAGGSADEGGGAEAGTPAEAEAASAPSSGESPPEPTPSSWLLIEGTDVGAGEAEVELAREASRGMNSTGIAPTLHLRCADGQSEVIIVWYEDPEGSDNDVTTQIGSESPVRRTWTNRNEDSTVFPRDSATVFIQRLMEADSLITWTNLYKRMRVTAMFDLTGLSERIGPLQEACGW